MILHSCWLTLLISCLLTSCTLPPQETTVAKDSRSFEILIGQLAHHIEMRWGSNELVIPGARDYVRYYDHYQTRSHINFQKGLLSVETIKADNPLKQLRQALIQLLLMGEEASLLPLFSTQETVPGSPHPFLIGQLLDHHGQSIQTRKQAEQFVDYLLKHQLKKRASHYQLIFMIQWPLVPDHFNRRAKKYLNGIKKAARRYQVEVPLILAIMQTESSFNPYAVSQSQALGLMQVKQNGAGHDVFIHLKRRHSQPSRRYLLDPLNNIDTGTAYLHLLRTRYLGKIRHPLSQRYTVIAAYNSGTRSVLRTFSSDECQAIACINRLSPEQVYQTLLTHHPSAQTRRYLFKVQKAYHYYTQLRMAN
ncbi:MAG: membrane-bound lytic murein transglycosylase MltC [Candidatus Symbiodolus clandestinus]